MYIHVTSKAIRFFKTQTILRKNTWNSTMLLPNADRHWTSLPSKH